jgi:hypothetical protein
MKNWIFTLITCILLAILGVLMFLSGFEVGGMHIGRDIIHIVAAVALVLYTVFALFPLVVRYRGILQGFVMGEVVILLLTAVAHIFMEYFAIPILSDLAVCSVLGLALWLRGAVETVHAYLSMREEDVKKRIPLWRLLLYILLSAVGVWQIAKPLVSDRVFIFVIGTISFIVAVIFGYATAMNRKAGADARLAKKAEKQKRKAEKKAAKVAPVAALPAPEQKSDIQQ